MVVASNEEPGCLYYDLNVSISDPQVMVFVERWESREALELHINSEHMNVWSKANKGYFIERKAELIYPDRVEDIPFVDPK